MWKWIVIAGIVIVAVPVLMAAIGVFLPREHVATSRARFAAPPDALFTVLTDFERWPSWNSSVRTMERGPDREGKAVWIATGSWGRMPSILEVVEPPRRLVTRIPEDAGLGFSGSWTYEITPDPDGAWLSITERGQVANPIFRFLSTLFFDPHRTAEQFLRSLGKRIGHSVTIERS